jgi:hypothetical protein
MLQLIGLNNYFNVEFNFLVSYIILIMGAHGLDFDEESQEFGTENADALECGAENAAREPENSDNAEYAAVESC